MSVLHKLIYGQSALLQREHFNKVMIVSAKPPQWLPQRAAVCCRCHARSQATQARQQQQQPQQQPQQQQQQQKRKIKTQNKQNQQLLRELKRQPQLQQSAGAASAPAWLVVATSLSAAGALGGTLLDALHTSAGLLIYDAAPLALGPLHSSALVPPLLAVFYACLGGLTLATDAAAPGNRTAAARLFLIPI